MLKLFSEGRIKMMERRDIWVDWADKAKGKIPAYNYYVQCENEKGDSEVMQFRSPNDLSKLVDVDAVLTFGYYDFRDRESGIKTSGLKLLDARSATT